MKLTKPQAQQLLAAHEEIAALSKKQDEIYKALLKSLKKKDSRLKIFDAVYNGFFNKLEFKDGALKLTEKFQINERPA